MPLCVRWRRPRPALTRTRRLTAVLAVAAAVAGALTPAQSAAAAAPACSSVGIGLTSLGGPNFYIDGGSTPSFTSSYTGYTVANSTGSALDDIWVQLSNFTGGSLNLAAGQAAAEQIATLPVNGSAPLFWYLNATIAPAAAQNYTVTVYRHNPALPTATALCTISDGFSSVQTTIAANANKVSTVTVNGGTPTLGSKFTVTVTGDTGQIGAGISNDAQSFWMSPAVLSTWPAASLRLVGTSLVISPDGTAPAQTYTNVLRLSNLGSTSRSYTATYTFQAIGFTASPTDVKPVEEIASGTQVKHTGSYPSSIPPIAAPTNTLSIAVSASPNQLNFGGGRVHYTARLTGTTGAAIDAYVVTPPSGATFVAGSATIDNTAVADPVSSGGNLVFQGPFTVNTAPSTLDFSLDLPGTAGNRSTAVVGTLGAAVIGATPSDISGNTPATATVNVDSAPTARPASATVPAGTTSSVDLSGYISDADADPVSLTSLTAAHGTVTATGTTLAYTPANGYSGPDTIGYGVSDGRGGSTTGSVAITVAVGAAKTQTITFPAPAALTVGGAEAAAATATSGLPITYRSTTPDVCTVDSSGVIAALAAGSCSVAAAQPGNGEYAAAPEVARTLSIIGRAQTVSFPDLADLTVGGGEAASATASSGLPISYRSATPDVCSVDADGNVAAVAGGACTITASQSGNDQYAAAPDRVSSMTVNRRSQQLELQPLSALTVGDTENAVASATSGLPVTYGTTTPVVCAVDATGVITALNAGDCTLVVDQAGDAQWTAAASVTATVNVVAAPVDAQPQPQTITFPALGDLSVHGSELAAATASSGLPVSYRSTTPETCTVDATGLVTALSAGPCIIAADQPGDTSWLAAPEQGRSLTVHLLGQVINVGVPAELTVGDTEILVATATSGLPITYGTATPDVCAIDATGVITAVSPGACGLTVAQPGNPSYAPAADVRVGLTVQRQSQTIDFPAVPDLAVGGSGVLTATASSGLAVRYRTTTPDVCAVGTDGDDDRIDAVAAGDCIVAADQAGSTVWAPAATVTRTVQVTPAAVGPAPQQIDFPQPADLTVGGSETGAATAGSGLLVTYRSTTPAVCTAAENGTISALAVGVCTVAADQPGDNQWSAADTVTRSLDVRGKQQELSLDAPSAVTVGTTEQASGTASSRLPVSYHSSTPDACSVDGEGAVTGLRRGDCTITADQPGDLQWAPARTATATLAVVGRTQQVTLTGPAQALATATDVVVSAVADSGLPVEYASVTADVCTVNGTGQVTFAASGLCTVRAAQSGSGSWDPADRSLTITVSRAPQHIIFSAPPQLLVGDEPYQLAAVSDANLPVTYVATPAARCEMDGDQLVAHASGDCTITASADGDARVAPATPVTAGVALVEPAGRTVTLTATPSGAHAATVDVLAGTSGLRLTGVDQPAHGTARLVTGGIRYVPTPTFRGTDPVTYRVLDHAGRAATGRVLMIVPDAAPTATDRDISQVAGTRRTVTVPAADVNRDRLTATVLTRAAGITVTSHERSVTITTAASVSGRIRLTVRISDGHGRLAIAHITDTVRPAPVPTATRAITRHGSTVAWRPASGSAVRYVVQVDGQQVCATAALHCRLSRLLGPHAEVTVTVAGHDRTRSSARAAAYAAGRPLLVATVYFDSAEWTLRSRQHHRLAGVGARLVRGGFSRVEVRGYTDAYGTAEYNLWLSEKRTHTVARILLARTGLHSTQSWYGKRHPVASSATARGAARNRRACVFAR